MPSRANPPGFRCWGRRAYLSFEQTYCEDHWIEWCIGVDWVGFDRFQFLRRRSEKFWVVIFDFDSPVPYGELNLGLQVAVLTGWGANAETLVGLG